MINETVDLLGRHATDKVTGLTGIVTSVAFDLYGCVQATVTPAVTKESEPKPGYWFDVNRLTIDEQMARAMPVPDFDGTPQAGVTPATYSKGAAEKRPL